MRSQFHLTTWLKSEDSPITLPTIFAAQVLYKWCIKFLPNQSSQRPFLLDCLFERRVNKHFHFSSVSFCKALFPSLFPKHPPFTCDLEPRSTIHWHVHSFHPTLPFISNFCWCKSLAILFSHLNSFSSQKPLLTQFLTSIISSDWQASNEWDSSSHTTRSAEAI
jgi:hypothetical protein